MPWTKPDFTEITLCMEVTAYVNTDDDPVFTHPLAARGAGEDAPSAQTDS
jgi:coenzyme PQQ precursor peptide PqqA